MFITIPTSGLLNKDYLKIRSKEISRDHAIQNILPGNPWDYDQMAAETRGDDATNDAPGTTHFVIVDMDGDVVSMTASVESIFGSTRMAGGMFLNNQLTDFSFLAVDEDGEPIANAVAPGKRPRSSMSPTIILDKNGDFLMATGSPGGRSIIAYTTKSIVGVLDWGLSAQDAVDLPNMVAAQQDGVIRIERNRASSELIESLRKYGYTVDESEGENSGLSVVVKRPDGTLEVGVDSRREGVISKIALKK